MSALDKIFGSWSGAPESGYSDEISALWNYLAVQYPGTQEQQNNSGLSQRRGEWTMLCDLYRRAHPKIVVEIGVAQGGTYAGWCFLGRPDALIIGIDRDVQDCRPRAGDQVHPRICSHQINHMTLDGGGMHSLGRNNQRIIPINGWSHEESTISQLKTVLGGNKIDWLYHDASHSKEMFATDFQIYWPLIASGGVFAVHDIQESKAPNCDKSVEWERIKKEEDYSMMMEFKGSRNEDSLGIGVLIK